MKKIPEEKKTNGAHEEAEKKGIREGNSRSGNYEFQSRDSNISSGHFFEGENSDLF